MHRILACRPKEQNLAWCAFLRERGLDVLDIPLLSIVDVERPDSKQAIKECVLRLDEFDYLIFISRNAAKHAFKWIDDFWPQLPQNLIMFAIGASTAKALEDTCEQCFPGAAIQIVSCEGGMNSEGLLRHESMRTVKRKKILIFKGVGGREYLEEVLSGRGASVECCELYARSVPEEAAERFARLALDKARDIFVVYSGETLSNLNNALDANPYALKKEIPLLVPGARVAAFAKSLGFGAIYSAENASETVMWQALKSNILDKK